MSANDVVSRCGSVFDPSSPYVSGCFIDPFFPKNASFFSRHRSPLFGPDDQNPSGGAGGDDDKGASDDDDDLSSDDDSNSDDDSSNDDDAVIPKRQYDGLMAETRKRKEKIARLEAEMKELRSQIPSPEELSEFRDYLKQKAEDDKTQKIKKGQYEELLARSKREHDAQIEKLQEQISGLTSVLESKSIDGELARLIPEFTSFPVADLTPLIRPHLSYDVEDDSISISVNGEHPLTANGKEMTLAEFVEDFISKKPHIASAAPRGGSGGKSQKGGGKIKGRLSAEQISKLGPAERAAALAAARSGDEDALSAFRR